jgi:ATP-dependent RNA helicase DDX35
MSFGNTHYNMKLTGVFQWSLGSSLDRDTENETGEAVVAHAEKQYRHLTLTQQRERLPVFKLRKELLYLLEKYQTVIVVGQTGCGKTTRK